jgi:hypothetical protein
LHLRGDYAQTTEQIEPHPYTFFSTSPHRSVADSCLVASQGAVDPRLLLFFRRQKSLDHGPSNNAPPTNSIWVRRKPCVLGRRSASTREIDRCLAGLLNEPHYCRGAMTLELVCDPS